MQPHGEAHASAPSRNQNARPDLARFRAWREQALPRCAYQITPRFWTPAGFASVQAQAESRRAALKSFEPMLTGMAYAPRNVHLVIATRVGDYADVARLIHCRSLMRDDPDHAEHRDKHVSMVLLCDQVPPAIEDFARRHHVRIVARAAVPEPDASIAAAPGSADSRPDWD